MGRYTFFDDVLPRAEWEVIQDQMAESMEVEVHTLGPDGQDLCPPSRVTRFRQLLDSSPVGRRLIPDGRLDVVRRTGARGELLVEETSTGRQRFSVPIIFRGEHLATVSGGGTVAAPLPAEAVRALAARAEVDADELLTAAGELRIDDRESLYAAGGLIASLLANLMAAVEHKQQAELQALRVQTLAKIGQVVTDSLDMHRVMEAVVDAIPQVMAVKACLVALVDDDSVLRTRAGWGVDEDFMAFEYRAGEGIAGAVLATGLALNVPSLPDEPRSLHREWYARAGLHTLLCVPLRDGDAVLGVVTVFGGADAPYNEDDEQLLANFADYTAAAVRNAQVYGRMRQAYRELGMATRRLQETQDRLLQSDRLAEVGRLAGGAAHEMRNYLGGIIGAASTVRDRFGEMAEEDVRELLAAIAEEGWRLRDTLEEVRGYTKPHHYGSGRHNVAEMVNETVRLLRFDAKFSRLPLETACDDSLEFIGDRDRCRQILLNLLRNAAEAVAGLTDRKPQLAVDVAPAGATVELRVTDNGVGIPAAQLERIWQPFYTTKGQAGTGLGLDMVRQMLQAQGGSISVASEPGVGTTFTVVLPAPPRT